MFGQTDLSDADLLRVASATTLPPSQPSSPARHLSNQLATTQISDSMNTATTTAAVGPFYTSGPQLARQLLSFPHVAGVRPTTLMNQLLSLLPPGDHPETMFMLLFLDRLPPNISAQLTARTFRHPRDMAAYADQIWDSTPPPAAPVAAALPAPPRSVSPASTVSMRSASRSNRSRSCSQSPAPHHRFDYCYYHQRFGPAAHHCQALCS